MSAPSPSGLSYTAQPAVNPDPAAQAGYRSILVSRAGTPRLKDGDRYRIGDRIGDRFEVFAIHHGGMGVVYGALDLQTRLPRALKSLPFLFSPGSLMAEMFLDEATVWLKLEKHPCVVQALMVQFYDWQAFMIAEYIRGPEGMGSDLRAWLGNPRLTLPVAVEMALQIALGMQHATRKIPGLVHRDLKPGNILVNYGRQAMVTDFGLASAAGDGAGTPAYMAPEQWRPGKLDRRADIYAYGCILYEMFTGYRMFAAASVEEWEAAHSHQMPFPMSALVAGIPNELERFVFGCLAKDPAARPKDWDEVVAVCAHWFQRLTGQPPVLEFSTSRLTETELIAMCQSLGNVGKRREMSEISARLLAEYPDSLGTRMNLVDVLYLSGEHNQAKAAPDRVLAMNPQDAATWTRIGRSLYDLRILARDAEKAALAERSMAAFERALAADPGYCDAWMGKGDLLRSQERTEDALMAYEQALSLDPRNGRAWLGKASLLEDLKRWQQALEAIERAAAAHPAFPRVWRQKGTALLELGNAEAALAAFDHAIALDPIFRAAWAGKVEALARLERWEELLAIADRARNISGYRRIDYYKGVALSRLGRPAKPE